MRENHLPLVQLHGDLGTVAPGATNRRRGGDHRGFGRGAELSLGAGTIVVKGWKRTPELTGTSADQALRLVRGETQRVCAAVGFSPPPAVHIVAGLRSTRDNATAEVRALKRRREYEINMPLRVVESCSPDALRWLVAHEVGHVITRSTSQERFRSATLILALVAALLCLGTTVAGAAEDLSGGVDEWSSWRAVAMGLFLISLGVVSALARADERRADVFATMYLGQVKGAEEYFAFTRSTRLKPSRTDPLFRFILWPLRSHPSPRERLKLMRQHLPPGGAFGLRGS